MTGQWHVVGIDPSMSGSGVAVIRPDAAFRPRLELVKTDAVVVPPGVEPTIPQLYRLRRIVATIRTIALTGREQGDHTLVVIEGPALRASKKEQHQDTRAMLRGILLHTMEIEGRPNPTAHTEGATIIVPPKSLKRYVAKNGEASKDYMKERARDYAFPGVQFTVGPRGTAMNDNLVDAYGLAAMGCRVLGFPVEPSPQRVDPGALAGVWWPPIVKNWSRNA
jgi:hypothetical protein